MRSMVAYALAALGVALGLVLGISYWTMGIGMAALLLSCIDLLALRGTADTRRLGRDWSSLICGGLSMALALI